MVEITLCFNEPNDVPLHDGRTFEFRNVKFPGVPRVGDEVEGLEFLLPDEDWDWDNLVAKVDAVVWRPLMATDDIQRGVWVGVTLAESK